MNIIGMLINSIKKLATRSNLKTSEIDPEDRMEIGMSKERLFDFYQNLYFHEIDLRDKLQARMQIPFAILVTLFGFLSYMLRNMNGDMIICFDNLIFILLFCVSFLSTLLAVYFFIRSWYGYSYEYLPSPSDIDEYRVKLIQTYADYDNGTELVGKHMQTFIYEDFVQCSTTNTRNNDKRSYFGHRTNQCLILAFILAFMAFIPFHFGSANSISDDVGIANQSCGFCQRITPNHIISEEVCRLHSTAAEPHIDN